MRFVFIATNFVRVHRVLEERWRASPVGGAGEQQHDHDHVSTRAPRAGGGPQSAAQRVPSANEIDLQWPFPRGWFFCPALCL